jgi:hypothetical protein
MLASALDRQACALAHFELAVKHCDQAGLVLRGAEARLQLASHLPGSQSRRALSLTRAARANAQRLAAPQVTRDAASLSERFTGSS